MKILLFGWRKIAKWFRQTKWVDKALEPVTMLTVAIVIVSALQWLVMSRTDRTMDKQLTVMQNQTNAMQDQTATMRSQLDEMKVEQRPWVYTDIALNDDLFFLDNRDAQVSLRLALQNVGHLPALHVLPLLEVSSSMADLDTPEKCLARPVVASAGRYVFPGQTQVMNYRVTMPANGVAGKDTVKVEVKGCIRYDSPADATTHYTSISLALFQRAQGKVTMEFDPSQRQYAKDSLELVTESMNLGAN